MKSHKRWIVPLCVIVLLAAAVAGWLIVRANRMTLVDYARSLPDEGYFVSQAGNVWLLDKDRYNPEGLGLRSTGLSAGPEVNVFIGTKDEELSPAEFTLRTGGLLRQDGTSWRRVVLRSKPHDIRWFAPYLAEDPVQETLRAEGVSMVLTGIEDERPIFIDGPPPTEISINLSGELTLPREALGKELTLYRSVCLAGKWYRIEEVKSVENETGGNTRRSVWSEGKWQQVEETFPAGETYTVGFGITLLPGHLSMDTLPPMGLYRLELYADGEPLHFQPFRFWYEGNVLHADEAEGQ